MDPVSPLPTLFGFAVALATVFFAAGHFRLVPQTNRFSSIDGLRGYLAFGVFLHHSAIWYFYLHTGKWTSPPSSLYQHLGKTSVAIFFMITGFLFYSKILSPRPIDWTRLFISRVMRLAPLYLATIMAVFVIVGFETDWKLQEPLSALVSNIFRWLLFLQADVNRLEMTMIITAGVTWTLPYEWSFYFLLPFIATVSGRRAPNAALTSLALSYFYIHYGGLNIFPFYFFLGGIGTAFLVRKDWFCQFAKFKVSSVIILSCMVSLVLYFPNAYGKTQLALVFIAFSLIAAGNSMFGVLTNRISRCFGEISYSIYLLHGLILYVLFEILLYPTADSTLPAPITFWSIILISIPVLILLSISTFRFIEKPGMKNVEDLSLLLKSVWASLRSGRIRFKRVR